MHESASVSPFNTNKSMRQPPLLPSPPTSAALTATTSNRPVRRTLSTAELDEKRANGLCYWCPEKYERGHKCKKQMYLIEIPYDDDDDDKGPVVVEEDYERAAEEETPYICMHVIHGSAAKAYRTMRVTGRVGNKSITILIDTDSIHNFLDLPLAKRLGLRLITVKPLKVRVAGDTSLTCEYMTKGLKWGLQDTTFITDLLLLPLGQCDMVLGIQWLETLGIIQWDFKNLSMTFTLQSKKHVLRGGKRDHELKTVSSESLPKLLREAEEVQLCYLKVQETEDGKLY